MAPSALQPVLTVSMDSAAQSVLVSRVFIELKKEGSLTLAQSIRPWLRIAWNVADECRKTGPVLRLEPARHACSMTS